MRAGGRGSALRAVYWRRRALVAGAAALALGGGAFALASTIAAPGEPERVRVAREYARALQREDYRAMRALLTPAARRATPLRAFRARHREALALATAARVRARLAAIRESGGAVLVPLRVETRAFGAVAATLRLPVRVGGEQGGVAWRPHLAFPGVRRGERLHAEVELPPRAALTAVDGSVLAAGPERAADAAVADVAAETVGYVGDPGDGRRAALREQGVPDDAKAGVNGLERALDDRLRGTLGGTLSAGRRVLGRQAPRQAAPVRTTILPSAVRAARDALGGRDGGAVALDPRTGAVLAFSGVPFSELEPPGSTFKIVTLVAALEEGVATDQSTYPYEQQALLDGAPLQNAHRELCGGTLVEVFAHSCNSVFAPLGAELGTARLVETAERFGFNRPSDIPGAATSVVPPAPGPPDALGTGATAIGQNKVLASALQMASVAATIARDGERPRLTLDALAPREAERATTPAVAQTVQAAMRAAVADGTGGAAAVEGVQVAGKTGTAELGVTQTCSTEEAALGECSEEDDPTDTDAWFAAYAPADPGATPTVAVGVMLMRAGAGGETAAPVAGELIRATLAAQSGP